MSKTSRHYLFALIATTLIFSNRFNQKVVAQGMEEHDNLDGEMKGSFWKNHLLKIHNRSLRRVKRQLVLIGTAGVPGVFPAVGPVEGPGPLPYNRLGIFPFIFNTPGPNIPGTPAPTTTVPAATSAG